ncbi:unnamed protein product [Rotaria sordida]|uniref:F-box domain-containing protein n=1 Tax=Rotaria sordida TaxID=392033 RepID=A0A813ZH55_9BILA|nr:unnamed protein product [Rotaria sordida]
MNLECLPNETLLDLFEYFNGDDLLRAFYGLNLRFNLILYKQFRTYRFHFNSISKRILDMICQQHLPFIADRVIDLSLSDGDETPEQINLFLSYISSFNQFTHLQSLTLFHLNSHKTLLILLDECRHLNNLMYLNITSWYLSKDQVNCQVIVDNIWSLPKLIKCDLNIDINKHNFLCLPTIISLSLESVTTHRSDLKMNQINQLLEYTPRLKHLLTSLAITNDDYIPSPLSMLIDFENLLLFFL